MPRVDTVQFTYDVLYPWYLCYTLRVTKTCTKCGEVKPVDAFAKDKTKRDGRYPSCKSCRLVYGEANRAALLAYNQRWRAENPEKMRAAVNRWHAGHKEQALRQAAAWKQAHPEEVLAYKRSRGSVDEQRRRARKASAGGTYTAAEWRALCAALGNRCLACGSAGPLTVDHVVPLAMGGSNGVENLQPLCNPCNVRKGRSVMDYRPAVAVEESN